MIYDAFWLERERRVRPVGCRGQEMGPDDIGGLFR